MSAPLIHRKLSETVDAMAWLRQSRLQPSSALMNHQRLWNDGFLVKLFDGPTPAGRRDFHINTSPEFFYQFDGEMRCRLRTADGFEDVVVGEGEMYLVPAGVPHLNQRDEGSRGLVIHDQRDSGALDGIAWYCESCAHLLYQAEYVFTEIRQQLPLLTHEFLSSEVHRTCDACGDRMPADQGAWQTS